MKTFSPTDDISRHRNIRGIYRCNRIPKLYLKVTKFSKKWKIWPKTHLLVLALSGGNFSNKHHYNVLKFLRIFCWWNFCPNWLFSKLFVLKVDLCIKAFALIKVMTVVDISKQGGGTSFKSSYLACQSSEIKVVQLKCENDKFGSGCESIVELFDRNDAHFK